MFLFTSYSSMLIQSCSQLSMRKTERILTPYFRIRLTNLNFNQAETMKLQQQATDKRSQVEDAYRKLDMGLPPTEDAEVEWQRMVRDEEMKSNRILQKQQVYI